MSRLRRSSILGLFTLAVLFAWAHPASAQLSPSPENFSAANQYVEDVPTSAGPHAAVGKGKGTPLPPGISGRLTAKDDGLKRIATSETLGAPRRHLHHGQIDAPGVPRATVTALDGSGNSTLWLVLGLLLATGAVVGTAGYRHYDQRKTATGG
jgi:hypothetical protein